MNNQITILDRNNQSVTVDLICYFSTNNKKYLFYSKNETVQDGLIKMYVSEENSGLTNDISPEEWNNLKKIMQGIITGNISNIEFLSYNNQVVFNEPKAIALNDANINSIKTAYKNAIPLNASNEPVLNKDILSQSFGGNNVVQEPVQISEIPKIQNTFNMESTPVNLNMTSSVEETNVGIEPIMPLINNEPTNSNVDSELSMPVIEPIPSVESNPSTEPVKTEVPEINDEIALNINSIKPGGIDSGFKVSDQPNIFDNPVMPYQISEEEINKTVDSGNNAFNLEPTNMVVNNTNNIKALDNINLKKIELNNRKIKLFEELASIYKEENELLNNGNSSKNDYLEDTASNLFNSNGTLNDNEVLG